MANEIRLRRNNIAGTITDNPLAIGATTINSAGFADLPVVDATNHLILILDPLEVGGTAEIVRVTAHTAAATSVTVVRGQEGSVARSHVFGTTWFHGPVASDHTGVLGFASVTAGQGGIAAVAVDLTGLTKTVTVGTNRRIRVTGHVQVLCDATAGLPAGDILEDGVVIGRWMIANLAAGERILGDGSSVTIPVAGSHTYKLNLRKAVGAGDVNTEASATNPAYILIEDLGPSTMDETS